MLSPHVIRNSDQLIQCFNQCFLETHNTRLVSGGVEPIYLPAFCCGCGCGCGGGHCGNGKDSCPDALQGFNNETSEHQIIFRHDYFSSALHEAAHWCVAGQQRRQQIDYGYWYAPDGRSETQQKEFEQVEVRPQAVEWVLHVAAGERFKVSVDNLNGDPGSNDHFKDRVYQQVIAFCHGDKFPPRALIFAQALAEFYGAKDFWVAGKYNRSKI